MNLLNSANAIIFSFMKVVFIQDFADWMPTVPSWHSYFAFCWVANVALEMNSMFSTVIYCRIVYILNSNLGFFYSHWNCRCRSFLIFLLICYRFWWRLNFFDGKRCCMGALVLEKCLQCLHHWVDGVWKSSYGSKGSLMNINSKNKRDFFTLGFTGCNMD